MHVIINAYHESVACTWCERSKCCVTVEFSDGFLKQAPLCWRCLQKAVRVRNRTPAEPRVPQPAKQTGDR